PTGINLVSGQGTNSINVSFDETFTSSGVIRVSAANGCGTSGTSNLTVSRNIPGAPGTPVVSGGTAKVCPGDLRSYEVNGQAGMSYDWIVPVGATIISGQGTDSIAILFDDSFTSTGTLRVAAVNGCGDGNTSSISISRNLPGAPGTPVVSEGAAKVCPGD